MSENAMIIKIESDAIELTTVKDGLRSTKMTNLRAIQEVLTKETALETPLMPGPYGTRKYIRKNERELTVMATPAHIREVKYDWREEGIRETRTYKIAIPNLIWFIHTIVRPGSDQRQYNSGMVKAMIDPLFVETQQMAQFPFSNVDGNWMCWGGNNPELGNLNSLSTIPDRFLDMKFNNHLDYGNYEQFPWEKNGQKVIAQRVTHLFEFLAAAETKEPGVAFPTKILKKENTFKEELDNQIRNKMRA
jgi:hypothetical protein